MKSKLIILTIFLISNLAAFSQTSSKQATGDCIVPCESLKKALIMKEDKKLLEAKFDLVKDSLGIYQQQVELQKQLISNKDQELEVRKTNESKYKEIVGEKDKQISTYKSQIRKQKMFKFISMGSNVVLLAGVALLLL